MKLLVLNGPNLNMLGIREPNIYGKETYPQLVKLVEDTCHELGVEVEVYQSNHEGDLVDKIQAAYGTKDAIVINPAARVVLAAGCPIPELFAREGEEAFRALEHQALCQAGRASGTVIATGGGIVTRRENWAPMRENSTVIFLWRPLDQLPLDGRPVSKANPLEELYEKRLPLYEKAADLTVDNDQVDRAVDEIIRRLKL